MGRGLVAGILLGLVVAVLGLGTLSVLDRRNEETEAALPDPVGVPVAVTDSADPAPIADAASPESDAPAAPADIAATAPEPTPPAPVAEPETETETASVQPEVLATPADPAAAPAEDVPATGAGAPVADPVPVAPAAAPDAPAPDAAPAPADATDQPEVLTSTESAAVPAEDTAVTAAPATAVDQDLAAPESAQAAPAADPAPGLSQKPAAPEVQADGIDVAPAVAEAGATLPPALSDPVPGADVTAQGPVSPGAESLPMPQAQPQSPDAGVDGAAPGSPPDDGTLAALAPPVDPSPGSAAPGLEADGAAGEAAPQSDAPPAEKPTIKSPPVASIGDLAPNVTTNRLPRIGVESVEAAEAAPVETGDELPAAEAILRNAAAFENPDNQPVMAVLLIDAGGDRTLLGDLKNLPFPVSFVVDAAAADAAEAVAFYRAAGGEVALSVPLPAGAAPTDVEVTFQVYAPLLDQSVAAMLPPAAGFQTMGATARQVATVLAETGHGLVSLPQGLNTGHKSAVKEGVPAGLVFRELDNDGQSAAVIRRFMDNAAFKARQEKGVIMLGRASVETLQALIEWSLGNRAKTVSLAPLSVVLQDR